ncbi:MAG: C-terminal binding protein [Shinella sp.]|nr:C-terminal binding protein [Shinella sp.]
MKRLIVTDQAFGNTEQEAAVAAAEKAEFRQYQCTTEAETADAVAGADVVMNNFAPMTHRVMKSMARGAVIIRYGVGVDNVDLSAAKELGVSVCNVPDYGVEEVADHAAAIALSLRRRLGHFDEAVREGRWGVASIASHLPSLRDTVVGLLGFGRIARAFAERMQAFGCRIIAFDPYVAADVAEATGVEMATREDVIRNAHILSLHVPLTKETRHVIDAAAIAMMQRGAILINASRGGLIDESALADALATGQLSAAGLDVFEQEPPPAGSPLRYAPNLLMTPHAAFYSDASVKALQRLAAEEAGRALRGEPLRCALKL